MHARMSIPTRTHASAMTGPEMRLVVWADTAAPLKAVHPDRRAGVKPEYTHEHDLVIRCLGSHQCTLQHGSASPHLHVLVQHAMQFRAIILIFLCPVPLSRIHVISSTQAYQDFCNLGIRVTRFTRKRRRAKALAT
jgi:hypothetical protein